MVEFQSTLPAWGETIELNGKEIDASEFQSTLPAWGETVGYEPQFMFP